MENVTSNKLLGEEEKKGTNLNESVNVYFITVNIYHYDH